MKRLFLIIFLIFTFTVIGNAQNVRMFFYSSNPSGGCQNSYFAENTTTGSIFYCKQNQWLLLFNGIILPNVINTSAMSAQSSATCTNVTGMTWNIAANKNYILDCSLPTTLAASATIAYCLGGPGTATSYSLSADGDIGAAGIWGQISTLAQTSYGTKTSASAAVAANSVIHVHAVIQNGSTASGTALTLQTAANGTNNITNLANGSCSLIQTN